MGQVVDHQLSKVLAVDLLDIDTAWWTHELPCRRAFDKTLTGYNLFNLLKIKKDICNKMQYLQRRLIILHEIDCRYPIKQ